MKRFTSEVCESESAMTKNKIKTTFKQELERYYSYSLSYSAPWMMPKGEVRNTRTCLLLTNGVFNILAYMSQKGSKKRIIMINHDGVFRLDENLEGNACCIIITHQFRTNSQSSLHHEIQFLCVPGFSELQSRSVHGVCEDNGILLPYQTEAQHLQDP